MKVRIFTAMLPFVFFASLRPTLPLGSTFAPAWRATAPLRCCATPPTPAPPIGFTADVTLEQLRLEQAAFVAERDWAQFHTPRSLALALVGEVARAGPHAPLPARLRNLRAEARP